VMRILSIVIIASILVMVPGATGEPGLGSSGPLQVFSGQTGRNITSYIRVYNEGNETGIYRVSMEGNASEITTLSDEYFNLTPGDTRRVSITYAAPGVESNYTGTILLSLEGTQIVPTVRKEVVVRFERPVANHAPVVDILRPGQGDEVSGDVDVVVRASDQDGDDISIIIYIDGEMVSEGETHVWETDRYENGEHELFAVASDGTLSSNQTVLLRVDNQRKIPPALPSILIIAGVILVIILLLFRRGGSPLQ